MNDKKYLLHQYEAIVRELVWSKSRTFKLHEELAELQVDSVQVVDSYEIDEYIDQSEPDQLVEFYSELSKRTKSDKFIYDHFEIKWNDEWEYRDEYGVTTTVSIYGVPSSINEIVRHKEITKELSDIDDRETYLESQLESFKSKLLA
jgi:hypothetical protein